MFSCRQLAQILKMISWPEKNDTAMHVERLANQNLSFSDGGVIFILLHTFRDLQSLSKWVVTNFKYLCHNVPQVSVINCMYM